MCPHTTYYGIFFITIPTPHPLQFPLFQLPGIHYHQFISATSCKNTRCFPIQISHSHLIPILANKISVPVIPFRPVHPVYLFPRHPIQYGQVFTSTTNTALFVLHIIITGSFHRNFRLTIPIEIINDKRRIPNTRLDARSHIIRPKPCTVAQISRNFICLTGSISRHARIYIGFGSTDDIIVNAITIQVGQSNLTCFGIIFQANGSIVLTLPGFYFKFFGCGGFLPFQHRHHPIGSYSLHRCVVYKITSMQYGLIRQTASFTICFTIYMKSSSRRIRIQQPPT